MSWFNWLLLIGGGIGLFVGTLLYCLIRSNRKAKELYDEYQNKK